MVSAFTIFMFKTHSGHKDRYFKQENTDNRMNTGNPGSFSRFTDTFTICTRHILSQISNPGNFVRHTDTGDYKDNDLFCTTTD